MVKYGSVKSQYNTATICNPSRVMVQWLCSPGLGSWFWNGRIVQPEGMEKAPFIHILQGTSWEPSGFFLCFSMSIFGLKGETWQKSKNWSHGKLDKPHMETGTVWPIEMECVSTIKDHLHQWIPKLICWVMIDVSHLISVFLRCLGPIH